MRQPKTVTFTISEILNLWLACRQEMRDAQESARTGQGKAFRALCQRDAQTYRALAAKVRPLLTLVGSRHVTTLHAAH